MVVIASTDHRFFRATLSFSMFLLISTYSTAQEVEDHGQQNSSIISVEILAEMVDMKTIDLKQSSVQKNLEADDEGFETFLTDAFRPTALSEWQIANSLWSCFAPSLLVLGTIGNVLTFFVLQTRSFRHSAIGFALSALTVVDTSLLWTSLLRQTLLSTVGYDIRKLNFFVCKTHFFASCYLSHLSSWTIATLSVERALSIGRPYAAKLFPCSRRRIVVAWSVVAIVLAIVNMHFFWNTEYFISDEDSYDYETTVFSHPTSEKKVHEQSEQNESSYSTPWEINYPAATQSGVTSAFPLTDGIIFSESGDTSDSDRLGEGVFTSSRSASSFSALSSAVDRTVAFDLQLVSVKVQGHDPQVMFIHSAIRKPGYTIDDKTLLPSPNGNHSNAGHDRYHSNRRDLAAGSVDSLNYSYNVTVESAESFCIVSEYLQKTIWSWADHALFVLLPFLFIITSNLAVICRLWRSNSVARAQDFIGHARTRPITSSTMMLMAVSAAFLLSTTPLAVHLLLAVSWLQTGDAQTFVRLRLSHCVCSIVYYAGSSLNFLLYCFSGSRFRRALRETLTVVRVRGNSNQRSSRVPFTAPLYSEYACSLKALKSHNSVRRNKDEMLNLHIKTSF